MSKYSQDSSYIYYKDTNIPVNKLSIKDQSILEAEERELLLKGYEHFHKKLSDSTIFDEKYFKELHKKLLGSFILLLVNIEQKISLKDIQLFAR